MSTQPSIFSVGHTFLDEAYVMSRMHRIAQVLAVLLGLFSGNLWAPPGGGGGSSPISVECSDDQGQANLNELLTKPTSGFVEFVEFKILESGVDVTNWQICEHTHSNDKTECTTVGVGDMDAYPPAGGQADNG